MSKYCIKCGKPLPKGVEICPDCSDEHQEKEAALFTRMTSETEVWKSPEPAKQKKQRASRARGNRRAGFIGVTVLVVALIAGCMVLLFRPTARVVRTIRSGDIQRAYDIYWSTSLPGKERVPAIDKAIMAAADKLCNSYANHEIDADTAATQLSVLGGFGEGAAEMLEETYAEFRSFNSSREHMEVAEQLFSDGDYLAAYEEYLKVLDSDADYAAAQEKAAACFTRYGESMSEAARACMEQNDYVSALAILQEGNDVLASYDTFSEQIDSTLMDCYAQYEQYVLAEAENLATLEDFDAAVEMIRSGMEGYGSEPESFTKALETYVVLAREQHIADAGERADALYAEESYADAFAELEEIREAEKEGKERVDILIEAMEERFAADTCAKAEERFAGARDNLPETIELLEQALEIRPLEQIRDYRDDLAQYLPLNLVEAEYSEKTGTVFRSDSTFESLDGTNYKKGWIWGENNAEITFALDGAYDLLECSFAVRRDDNANANGRFELWADGEQLLRTDKLYHFQTEPQNISLEISGCKELKIIFSCDYTVSTAENGYCYHGICNPILTKNIPEA